MPAGGGQRFISVVVCGRATLLWWGMGMQSSTVERTRCCSRAVTSTLDSGRMWVALPWVVAVGVPRFVRNMLALYWFFCAGRERNNIMLRFFCYFWKEFYQVGIVGVPGGNFASLFKNLCGRNSYYSCVVSYSTVLLDEQARDFCLFSGGSAWLV